MIKIKSELINNSGFKSSISVLEVTNYTLSHTVSLVTGSTMPPMHHTGRNINVNYSIYKSVADKENGAVPYQPTGLPFNYHFQLENEQEVTESLIYELVSTRLNNDGTTPNLFKHGECYDKI